MLALKPPRRLRFSSQKRKGVNDPFSPSMGSTRIRFPAYSIMMVAFISNIPNSPSHYKDHVSSSILSSYHPFSEFLRMSDACQAHYSHPYLFRFFLYWRSTTLNSKKRMKIVPNHLQEVWFLMLFMQKERNMSEYIDFITYQDDAIIQRPLRYYRRRGQPHQQPKGDLH